ncbi:hypothetical protein CEXT_720631 [Caerostris extrusa]|uniref:Uncharacterized protein n=1 Tax=Caerostris extrusa TaxID=172846 RepID=A0AAV4R0B5_CAEEX|nr:hypothetical protein CEXT_720631 [Caerostris extrusa]
MKFFGVGHHPVECLPIREVARNLRHPTGGNSPFPLLIRRILRLGSALSSEMLLLAPLLLALLPAVPASQAGISPLTPPQMHPHSKMYETISNLAGSLTDSI